MDFEIFDRETRAQLAEAGVDVPSSPSAPSEQSAGGDEWAERVLSSLPVVGQPPDPDSAAAAFGHWAEDREGHQESRPTVSEAANKSDDEPGIAHPPIDVRGWTTEEIRRYYHQEMQGDWANSEVHNEHMNQDIQARLAYEATGVYDTWQMRKLQAPMALAALGLAEAFPMAAWFLGMSQAENENEAALASMFYPFKGGGWAPRSTSAEAESAAIGMSSATREARNPKNGLNLKKQLASEQQNAALVSGEGQVMAGTGHKASIRDEPRLVSEHGGSIGDWQKVRSTSYTAPDGTKIETHAYQNSRTGEVVEPKSKIVRKLD